MVRNHRGFSLIELLVVTVIMGLVVASIYTLYTGTQKTAITSEEVVDVQQNLRFALDQIASDIRLAGFLVPVGTAPFAAMPASLDGNVLTTNTSMPTRRYARIVGVYPVDPLTSETSKTFLVAVPEMVDLFGGFTGSVSIIRPALDPVIILPDTTVTDSNRLTPAITLADGANEDVRAGDLIIPIDNFGYQVAYSLESDPDGGTNVNILRREIRRVANGTVVVVAVAEVAGKISEVEFEYIPNTGDPVAVRVRIEGQTDETMTGQQNFSGIKTRALETVVRLRNR